MGFFLSRPNFCVVKQHKTPPEQLEMLMLLRLVSSQPLNFCSAVQCLTQLCHTLSLRRCVLKRERGMGAGEKEGGGVILSLIHALLPPSALAEKDKRDD